VSEQEAKVGCVDDKKPKHFTFILDYDKQTPAVADATYSPTLRKEIQDRGLDLHIVSVNSTSVTDGGLSIALEAAGGAPCIAVQDAGGCLLLSRAFSDLQSARSVLAELPGV
jgi:hypothetical protein